MNEKRRRGEEEEEEEEEKKKRRGGVQEGFKGMEPLTLSMELGFWYGSLILFGKWFAPNLGFDKSSSQHEFLVGN